MPNEHRIYDGCWDKHRKESCKTCPMHIESKPCIQPLVMDVTYNNMVSDMVKTNVRNIVTGQPLTHPIND